MQKGDKVRVWKENCGVPVGSIGTVLAVDEESGYDYNIGDWWIEHLEVEFPGLGIKFMQDNEVEVVDSWQDKQKLEWEATREQREAETRRVMDKFLADLKKLAAGG